MLGAFPWKSIQNYRDNSLSGNVVRDGHMNDQCSRTSTFGHFVNINPLRPNSDLSQTSHCNIKG